MPGVGWNAGFDAMLTMAPPPAVRCIWGPQACDTRNVPLVLTSSTASHCAGVISSSGAGGNTPALLTTMSMRPKTAPATVARRQLAGHLAGGVPIAVGTHDRGPGFGQSQRGRQPDTRCRAGHER